MKKSSWVVLGICAALLCVLGYLYIQSHHTAPAMTQARVESMLDKMKEAVAHKNVSALMGFVDQSPETRISRLNVDQLRMTLIRAFRQSEQLDANYTGLVLHNDGPDSSVEFELTVVHRMADGVGQDYKGHITLHLQRVETPHILGLYHTQEWKIVRAETDGPDLANYGDY